MCLWLCVFLCFSVCLSVFICIYIVCSCLYTHMCALIWEFLCVFLSVCVFFHNSMCIYVYLCVCVFVCVCVCVLWGGQVKAILFLVYLYLFPRLFSDTLQFTSIIKIFLLNIRHYHPTSHPLSTSFFSSLCSQHIFVIMAPCHIILQESNNDYVN